MNIGQLKWQTAHIYPSEENTYSLPTDDHFRAFFSRFGPILDLQIDTFPDPKKDHAYLVFRNPQAIQELRLYLRDKTQTGYWKESCRIEAPISSKAFCPRVLVARLENNLNGNVSVSTPNRPSKRKESKAAAISGPFGNISGRPSRVSGPNGSETQDASHPTTKKKKFRQNDSDSPCNTTCNTLLNGETSVPRIEALEKEILKVVVERDEAKTQLDEMIAQRDEAIARLDREIETYRALKKELRKVKEEERVRDEEITRMSRLVSDSLSNLANKKT